MRAEWIARIGVVLVLLGLPVGIWRASQTRIPPGTIELHAALPDAGGWAPGSLQAVVGQPLHLQLTSTDVTHSFAVGQSDMPPVDVYPGKVSEVTLTFDKPGKYTFYCTRWCGVDHWRMRGTIEVSGAPKPVSTVTQPLYLQSGLDLDAPYVDFPAPALRPSARRGQALGIKLPQVYTSTDYVRTHSPLELFEAIRRTAGSSSQPGLQLPPLIEGPLPEALLTDQQVWDLAAWTWQSAAWNEASEEAAGDTARETGPEQLLAEGKRLYAVNCAACHGETGIGDGVMAEQLVAGLGEPGSEQNPEPREHPNGEEGMHTADSAFGHQPVKPADFTDLRMLGHSSARLQGKILRGGMGTGMPYWGPIFTEAQTWALVRYLWSLTIDFSR